MKIDICHQKLIADKIDYTLLASVVLINRTVGQSGVDQLAGRKIDAERLRKHESP